MFHIKKKNTVLLSHASGLPDFQTRCVLWNLFMIFVLNLKFLFNCKDILLYNTISRRGAPNIWDFFEVKKKWNKYCKVRQDIFQSFEILLVWKIFLYNFILLVFTMVVGPIIGKFDQHPKTKKRLHPSYTINHSIVQEYPNF